MSASSRWWLGLVSVCMLGCPGGGGSDAGTEGSSGSSSGSPPGTTVGVDGTTSSSSSGPGSSSTTADPTTTGSTSDTGSDSTGDTTGGVMIECSDPATAMYPGPLREVDVLFVVDNSGTMAQAQINLTQAMDSFLARLDNEGIDYRIGVTTTDVGNPWCNVTTPESGRLVLSSCRERLTDFVFNGAVMIDVTQEACLDLCPLDTLVTQPTTTELDPVPTPRPWIQRVDGADNLPPGVSPSEALHCMIPQGISGCGFERPLEALRLALLRTSTDLDESYGFLRAGADLLVVLVSDEVDCSHDPSFETIFLPDGNRVFWSDPMAPAPTSAVCWNAGVECTGGPGMYDECHAQNYDVDADPTGAGSAVLFDLARYTNILADVDAANGAARVRLAVLGGVPQNYPFGADLIYADSPDPIFQNDFGIGAGCDAAGVTALPPVRMREVAEAYADPGERNLYSLCNDALCEAFEGIIDDVVQ